MFNNPFLSLNIDLLQLQYLNLLETINRMKASEINILGEINKELSSLGKDELGSLYESDEYLGAKSIYETGFLEFISNKFAGEYLQTPQGKEAGLNLLNTIKTSKDKLLYEAKVKQEKLEKMLLILESDPEMKKRYSELTTNKKSKK